MSLPDSALKKALLVEGKNDVHVVNHIKRISLTPEFCVIPAGGIDESGGIDKLLAEIDAQIKASDRQVLGIIVDADDDLNARWQDVSNKLVRSGIVPPQYPAPTGTIIPAQNHLPRVGVWLWPDNQSPGELEDFIKSLIPEKDSVWPLSEEYIDKILAQKLNEFKPRKKSRAQVYAWLAVREDPRPMGLAIKSKDLNAKAPTCATFINWLTRLFAPA